MKSEQPLPPSRTMHKGESPRPRFQRSALIENVLEQGIAGFSTALPRDQDRHLAPRIQALLRREGTGLLDAMGPPLLLDQTHSTVIADRTRSATGFTVDSPPPPSNGDSPLADGACSTLETGGMLAVKTADCVAVLAADPETGGFAALHAGWRGTAGGILPALLAIWGKKGSRLRETVLALGPHIRSCCFEVRADCLARFSEADLAGAVVRQGDRIHLDLEAVLRTQAARFRLGPERIEASPRCTRCHATADGSHPYASHRRTAAAGSALAHINVGVIGAVPASWKDE